MLSKNKQIGEISNALSDKFRNFKNFNWSY